MCACNRMYRYMFKQIYLQTRPIRGRNVATRLGFAAMPLDDEAARGGSTSAVQWLAARQPLEMVAFL